MTSGLSFDTISSITKDKAFFGYTRLTLRCLTSRASHICPTRNLVSQRITGCVVNNELLDGIKNIILYAKCNYTSANTAGHLISISEVDTYLSVVANLQDMTTRGMHAVCVVEAILNSNNRLKSQGRIMHNITYNQFMNFYGQSNARLHDEDVYWWISGWDYSPSLWMTFVSWLLFRAPKAYVTTLHDIYLDKIANRYTWNEFIVHLNMQLQDFNLLATVLLNANVGFLAIQSVDNGNNGQRSFTQIASYWSLSASVGSILLGTFLVRFHQSEGHKDVAAVATFLKKIHSHKRGLEQLAIVYSLPYALLMWSLVFFSVAFITEAYQTGDRSDIISLGVIVTVTLYLVFYGTFSILYGSHNTRVVGLRLLQVRLKLAPSTWASKLSSLSSPFRSTWAKLFAKVEVAHRASERAPAVSITSDIQLDDLEAPTQRPEAFTIEEVSWGIAVVPRD
ncbi:hypothetical protein CONPUDRAFT_145765 [Coniophora puteana RWD-64-598 SS2]|uniref:Uncharacterized protein n=1 Tax=Coniophora puteana (strain RWD-64-598) TaxID=741705 RepID=A0A5M3MH90_CONPW|nr:uncharacterized protein CONPUDRAFT_145765 [Coniophora puteana RWD-64-598 SS2]EIW78598.1 hypothetical protein CONPUDRAFT_145765 [Coniophora puteana RWD-64-598 SS2]